ncbi:hypothetical protein [Burkholderia perseverans]|uniref:hypothetical protein n=1 Tax=Burkholderia perseverans TaxID=2615214 RepID=UPI001FEE834E|nr:hypothetical protein [Burkholderia perseverans]
MSRDRDRWIDAREIASLRQLQRQRAVTDAARVQAALETERERQQQAEADHDAQLRAWRAAASADALSPALLVNGAAALAAARARCDAAGCRVKAQAEALDAARHALRQRDRLAEAAEDLASREAARHRRTLDEQRMSELELRLTLPGDTP